MTEVAAGIYYVDGSNANCYVVEDADGALTLIDAGMRSDGKRILDFISGELSRKHSDVKFLVLTHCHVDHVRGAAAIKAATGGAVVVHAGDAGFVDGSRSYPSPHGAMGLLFKAASPFFKASPVTPDRLLAEGDAVGGLKVVHTPGHTPGSIALYGEKERVLFVGDTVSYSGGRLKGPRPQFTLDMDQARASISRLSDLQFEVLLSGHGDPLKSNDAPRMLKDLSGG